MGINWGKEMCVGVVNSGRQILVLTGEFSTRRMTRPAGLKGRKLGGEWLENSLVSEIEHAG